MAAARDRKTMESESAKLAPFNTDRLSSSVSDYLTELIAETTPLRFTSKGSVVDGTA